MSLAMEDQKSRDEPDARSSERTLWLAAVGACIAAGAMFSLLWLKIEGAF